MTARIAYVSGGHPSLNPRLFKSAALAANEGWQVDVYHPIVDTSRTAEDQALAQRDGWTAKPYFEWDRASHRIPERIVHRVARAACQFGWETAAGLGYGLVSRLRPRLHRLAGYDVVVGHQEIGLWAAGRVCDSTRTWVDIEDWYSRDLLPEARRERPIRLLDELLGRALTRADACTTTTQAMADALHEEYGGRPAQVVYNTFMPADRDVKRTNLPSFTWFSQTIGPGRGLETLAAAMNRLDGDFEVHLRGRITNRGWLFDQLEPRARSRVHLHPLVANDELPRRIAEHDCGLALENTTPDNKNLTASNKIFHYLLNGLHVIATDTAGQTEILRRCDPQRYSLIKFGDAAGLAQAMATLIKRHPVSRPTGDIPEELQWPAQARTIAGILNSFSHEQRDHEWRSAPE